jgi:hypothetical protein
MKWGVGKTFATVRVMWWTHVLAAAVLVASLREVAPGPASVGSANRGECDVR